MYTNNRYFQFFQKVFIYLSITILSPLKVTPTPLKYNTLMQANFPIHETLLKHAPVSIFLLSPQSQQNAFHWDDWAVISMSQPNTHDSSPVMTFLNKSGSSSTSPERCPYDVVFAQILANYNKYLVLQSFRDLECIANITLMVPFI